MKIFISYLCVICTAVPGQEFTCDKVQLLLYRAGLRHYEDEVDKTEGGGHYRNNWNFICTINISLALIHRAPGIYGKYLTAR